MKMNTYKKRWTQEEDNMLVESYRNNQLDDLSVKFGRSYSNINQRKMQLARNMVLYDKKTVNFVCDLLKINNDDLVSRINQSVKIASEKNNKHTKKKLDQSHANLIYSYKELYNEIKDIKIQLNEIKELINKLC